MPKKEKSQWVKKVAFYALQILKENGAMRVSAVMKTIEENKGNIIPRELYEIYPSNQIAKWKIQLRFYSILFVKAGLLNKDGGGIWSISEKGLDAVARGIDYVNEKASEADKEFISLRNNLQDSQAPATRIEKSDNGEDSDLQRAIEVIEEDKSKSLEDEEENALQDIEEYILNKEKVGWEKFQILCAALLRGMGYYVREISSPGRDGGVDVLAYTDPIGSKPPRIKLQAKYSEKRDGNKVTLQVVTQLEKLLTTGDIGIIVSTSSFSLSIRNYARDSTKQIELIDLTRFIKLWREHYEKMSEGDRALLPLRPIYFLDKAKVSK